MNTALTLFPEKAPTESALDRLAVAAALRLRRLPLLRRRVEARLLAGVAAALPAQATLDDAALRREARQACRSAYERRDAGAAALALACLSEVAFRSLGLRPHRPQLLACWHLVQGRLVELDTGEGKTLTAGLGAAFAALAGAPAHVVTVNDYLAQRDAASMAPLFERLGLSVGVVHGGVSQDQRAPQYAQDICYCTNKDLVFDYLRDRVNARGSTSRAQLAVRQLHGARLAEPLRLRGLHFAIVDEADSVLVDEARTPLILSARRDAQSDAAPYAALLALAQQELQAGVHYTGLPGALELLPEGRAHLEAVAQQRSGGEGADEVWHTPWMLEHFAMQALRALHVYRRDQHYVVHEGKVVIVDEFSGRMLPDRSWEQGLQQLVEVKEGCAPSGGNVTLARITYQSFFARYLRLSGISGTIRETADEMAGVLGIGCLRIEPNTPSRRRTLPPRLFSSEAAKIEALIGEVRAMQAAGRPVLVGTRSVRSSQAVSAALSHAGIGHRVLNALQNADEAALVAAAGAPGAVTVATNMAGRGTDIRLAPEAEAAGGLHVILTEWHESSRVDRQLYGRCARQGDPGSVRAMVALDDELLQRHAPAALLRLIGSLGAARWPVWAIEALRHHMQSSAERDNAAQRRRTLAQDRRRRQELAFTGAPE